MDLDAQKRAELAERFVQAMRKKGVTQADVAKESKVSPGQLSHLKSGQRGKEIGADQLFRIARALGVRPEWLLYGEEPMEGSEPPLLESRPEWIDVANRVREEQRWVTDDQLRAVGKWPDLNVDVPIDVDFVVDTIRAIEDLKSRASRQKG